MVREREMKKTDSTKYLNKKDNEQQCGRQNQAADALDLRI
jgi:hypothetical protein